VRGIKVDDNGRGDNGDEIRMVMTDGSGVRGVLGVNIIKVISGMMGMGWEGWHRNRVMKMRCGDSANRGDEDGVEMIEITRMMQIRWQRQCEHDVTGGNSNHLSEDADGESWWKRDEGDVTGDDDD